MKAIAIGILVLSTSALAAPQKTGGGAPPSAPAVVEFKASPLLACPNSHVTLTWNTVGSARIDVKGTGTWAGGAVAARGKKVAVVLGFKFLFQLLYLLLEWFNPVVKRARG